MSFHSPTHSLIKTAWFHVFIFLTLLGCLAPIEFPVTPSGGRLVVSGQVSTIRDQNFVQLGSTADLDRPPFPVSNASITLFDDLGNSFSYNEDFANPGKYTLDYFSGVPGRSYYIKVIRNDGRIYQSALEKIPEAIPLNSAPYEFIEKEVIDAEGAVTSSHFVKIYANSAFKSSSKGFFLKWNVRETFLLSPTDFPDIFGSIPPPCYIDQDASPQQIALFDGSAVVSSALDRFPVMERLIDWTFLERHYFTVYQSSITESAHDYWRKVDILANQKGSLFDTPPAEIIGNITSTVASEKAYGFFQAVNQSYARFFLLPGDFPFPLLFETCNFKGDPFDVDAIPNTADYQPRCIDCTKTTNSSYSRPDWF